MRFSCYSKFSSFYQSIKIVHFRVYTPRERERHREEERDSSKCRELVAIGDTMIHKHLWGTLVIFPRRKTWCMEVHPGEFIPFPREREERGQCSWVTCQHPIAARTGDWSRTPLSYSKFLIWSSCVPCSFLNWVLVAGGYGSVGESTCSSRGPQVWFPAPLLDSSQLSVTPTPGDLMTTTGT